MSSNESSSWMSMGLIPPNVTTTVTTTVSECCNGFMSWWNCASTESIIIEKKKEEEEDTLVELEPLVEQADANSSEVMDDRLQQTEESDLFLDEYHNDDDDETESSNNNTAPIKSAVQHVSYIENTLVTQSSTDKFHSRANVSDDEEKSHQDATETKPLIEKIELEEVLDIEMVPLFKNTENISSQSDVFEDEPSQQGAEISLVTESTNRIVRPQVDISADENHVADTSPLTEKVESEEKLDIKSPLLKDNENIPLQSGVSDDESRPWDEAQPTLQMKQSQLLDEHKTLMQLILPIEKKPSLPLENIENVLAAMDGEYEHHSSKKDEEASEPSSIFRSPTPESGSDDHDETPTIDGRGSSTQLVHETFEDEHEVDRTMSTPGSSGCDQDATKIDGRESMQVKHDDSIEGEHEVTTDGGGTHHADPAILSSSKEEQVAQFSSILPIVTPESGDDQDIPTVLGRESMQIEHHDREVDRSLSTPESGDDQDTSEIDGGESPQMKHDTFEDEHKVDGNMSTPQSGGEQDTMNIDSREESQQVQHDSFEDERKVDGSMSNLSEDSTAASTKSQVKKRVSDLIGIFESLSVDEEESVTPTSLCSSSSFSGHKPAHDMCPCCLNKIYPTDATIAYHDKLFHGGCFKCHLCDRKFSRGLSEVAGLVTNEDSTSMLTCTKCRDDAAVKHLPLRKSTPACQPITVTSPEKGNIQQVKDEIGEDLESVMDGMIPRCAICGIHFLGSGGESSDMMILGMNKYHRKCRMYGRPMVERSERKVLPIVAANYAPESLVVRISNTVSDAGDDSMQDVMTTLYFILPDKAADLQRIRSSERPNENVRFEYTMDSSAYANPNYEGTKKNAKTTFPCHGVGLAESNLSVGFLGDPFGLPIRFVNTRIEEDKAEGTLLFCAELECFKFQLRHRFDLVMHKKGESADLKTAKLSMNIIS